MTPGRLWTSGDMRLALAQHDVGMVFRLMQRFGESQRAIAALTGVSQAEVSEIVCRHRRVVSYDVLDRLTEGLGLPRGWVGLAYDDESAKLRVGRDLAGGIDLSRPTMRYSDEGRDARRRARRLLDV